MSKIVTLRISVIILCLFGVAASAQTGSIDSLWGLDGSVEVDFEGRPNFLSDVTTQSNGKILACGRVTNSNQEPCLGLVRLNEDGSIDSSFATNGWFNYLKGISTSGVDLELNAQDEIYVLAAYSTTVSGGFVVVKLHANGSLYTSFGNNGAINRIGFPNLNPSDLELSTANEIFVSATHSDQFSSDMALIKFNADGSLDNSFSSNVSLIDINSDDEASCLEIKSDGKILVGGTTTDDASGTTEMVILSFNPDGSSDQDFNSSGLLVKRIGAGSSGISDIGVLPDGRIVACGSIEDSNGHFYMGLACFLPNGNLNIGSLDGGFTENGWTILSKDPFDRGEARKLVVQDDGKILVMGTGSDSSEGNWIIWRVNLLGAPDQDFGLGGRVVARFGSSGYPFACDLSLSNFSVFLGGGSKLSGEENFRIYKLNNDIGTQVWTLNNLGNLKFFPNPILGTELNFEFEIKKEGTAQVFNTLGEMVTESDLLAGSIHTIHLDENLSEGAYFIQIKEEGTIRATGQILVD